MPEQAPVPYIMVDVCDSDVIHVYGNDDEICDVEGRDFIWNIMCRERGSDVMCYDRKHAIKCAERYAAQQANKLGCDWGSNGE